VKGRAGVVSRADAIELANELLERGLVQRAANRSGALGDTDEVMRLRDDHAAAARQQWRPRLLAVGGGARYDAELRKASVVKTSDD